MGPIRIPVQDATQTPDIPPGSVVGTDLRETSAGDLMEMIHTSDKTWLGLREYQKVLDASMEQINRSRENLRLELVRRVWGIEIGSTIIHTKTNTPMTVTRIGSWSRHEPDRKPFIAARPEEGREHHIFNHWQNAPMNKL